MDFDPERLRAGFDWDYRPKTYFSKPRAKSPIRVPKGVREQVGRIHPGLAKGLYLPDIPSSEKVIASVEIQSTISYTMRVCAFPVPGGIAYRVVDEDGQEFTTSPVRSAKPLTLRELVTLMEGATDYGGMAFGDVRFAVESGSDPEEMYGFAVVSSRFYPELARWYDRLIGAWLDSLQEDE